MSESPKYRLGPEAKSEVKSSRLPYVAIALSLITTAVAVKVVISDDDKPVKAVLKHINDDGADDSSSDVEVKDEGQDQDVDSSNENRLVLPGNLPPLNVPLSSNQAELEEGMKAIDNYLFIADPSLFKDPFPQMKAYPSPELQILAQHLGEIFPNHSCSGHVADGDGSSWITLDFQGENNPYSNEISIRINDDGGYEVIGSVYSLKFDSMRDIASGVADSYKMKFLFDTWRKSDEDGNSGADFEKFIMKNGYASLLSKMQFSSEFRYLDWKESRSKSNDEFNLEITP